MRYSILQNRGLPAPADLLALVTLAIVTAAALFTFKDYGLGWDDYAHSHYGEILYSYYASGFTDRRAMEFSNLFYYGGGFDLAASILDRFVSTDLFETRRLMGAIVGIAGLVIVWRLARRVAGPVAGFAAVLLLAITPIWYGHMFINAKDIPFAVAMALVLFMLVRAFEEFPKPRASTILLFGLSLGLLIGTRAIGALVFLFAGVALLVYLFADAKKHGVKDSIWRGVSFVGWLALSIPVAYAVMALVWPWSVQAPLNPLRAFAYFSNFWEKPWKELFDGAQIMIPEMPRTYLPKLCLLKIPEIVGFFALAGAAGAVVSLVRGHGTPAKRAALTLLVAAAGLPVLIVVMTRPVLYNGIRHFIFIVPPFVVLAGVAVAYVFDRLAAYRRQAVIAGVAAFAIGAGITVIDLVRIHPYQYALFNHVAGGVRGASDRYMIDYWGLGFKEASETLLVKIEELKLKKPINRKWRVAVCGPAAVVGLELGEDFVATNEAKGADFAVSLGTFYCAELFAPLITEVSRDHVVFARVYDLRKLNYKSVYAETGEIETPKPQATIHTFWR